MQISQEIRDTLLAILREGLLRIRAFGWAGNSEACAHEADHLHNLPWAIHENSRRLVQSYYDIGRPAFLKSAVKPEVFQPHWERLRMILVEANAEET
jgi:hypothetical protein